MPSWLYQLCSTAVQQLLPWVLLWKIELAYLASSFWIKKGTDFFDITQVNLLIKQVMIVY